jgi:hypothetical protein
MRFLVLSAVALALTLVDVAQARPRLTPGTPLTNAGQQVSSDTSTAASVGHNAVGHNIGDVSICRYL